MGELRVGVKESLHVEFSHSDVQEDHGKESVIFISGIKITQKRKQSP